MKFILISQGRGHTHSIALGAWARIVLSLCALGLPCGLAVMVYLHYFTGQGITAETSLVWANALVEQKRQARLDAESQINPTGMPVAALPARLMALDTPNKHLSFGAKIDTSVAFDFRYLSVFRWPHSDAEGKPFRISLLSNMLNQSAWPFQPYQQQMRLLSGVVGSPRLASGIYVKGEPRLACGRAVQVGHSTGLPSGYAQRHKNLVLAGHFTKPGLLLAALGGTGRSVSPHVYFESYKHGRLVDPASYIRTAVP